MRIKIDVSRAAALRAGSDAYGPQTVDVDVSTLSAQQRETLIACAEYQGVTTVPGVVMQAGVAGVVEALDAHAGKVAADVAARTALETAAREHALAALESGATVWSGQSADYPHPQDYEGAYRAEYRSAYDAVPGMAERRREQRAEQMARRAEELAAARAREDAARAERERRDAEAEAELSTWVRDHGSETARLLLEEQHASWIDAAAVEWLTAHTPHGFARLPESYSERDRTHPTAADVLALRTARALVVEGSGLSDPRMAWVVEYRAAAKDDDPEDVDRDGDVVADKYAAILLDVTAPGGATRTVARRVA